MTPPKFKVGDRVGFVSVLTGRDLPGRGRVATVGYQSRTTRLYRIVADDNSQDLGWFHGRQLRPVADERRPAGPEASAAGEKGERERIAGDG